MGFPPQFSNECTKLILDTIKHLTNWKVPLTRADISSIVKGYSDSQGVVDKKFKNNLPD